MIKGGIGGSSTKTGLVFEQRLDFRKVLEEIKGYKVQGDQIYFNGQLVALLVGKNKLYKEFLDKRDLNWKIIISKKLLPDEAIYVYSSNVLHIIEMKFQSSAGSVDEKLQTCDFKKKQYTKLLKPLGIEPQYTYILNDWYKQQCYNDVLDYIESVGCNYFFNEISLEFLGLPYPYR
ncbi:hypothetical protein V7161_27545 [Neobacillus drentensis]|uniref:hypothetical protein n=1 Tax=Neobacillus drentensis TaxID=220684 RepID=UPI0030026AE2